jgi:energy-converting hydrogenase Eha subunit F
MSDRRTLALFLSIVALAGVAVAVYLALNRAEERVVELPDLRSSEAVELAEKGWIPSDIPSDATSLRVAWDVDSSTTCGEFRAYLSAQARVDLASG